MAMQGVRVRIPFAAAFGLLLLVAAYLGLSNPKIPQYGQSDKGLHFITFFLLTLTFYWILDTSRRRIIHITLSVCTAGLCIGSEVLQGVLDNNRDFDAYDILANVVGSGLALGLCGWYHRRMLERRRKNKHYDIVPGEEGVGDGDGDDGGEDLELGEGPGLRGQETGTVSVDANGGGQTGGQQQAAKVTNVTEELDNWDENEEDWDEQGEEAQGAQEDVKKRAD